MAYASWSVVFGEQPTAAKWNILGTNDASFNDGTGFLADAIKNSKLFYGMIRNRQGGTTGDASWLTTGTSNTATDAKDTYIQCGSIVGSAGADVTVTFPSAYSQVPIVLGSNLVTTSNSTFVVVSVSTTTFVFRMIDTGGTQRADNAGWIAIGQ